MKIWSRGLAVALLLGAAPVGMIAAHAAKDGPWGMNAETRARLDDGKLAAAREALKIAPDQEKLWQAFEAEVRALYKARADKRAERQTEREARRSAREADKGAETQAARPARPDIAARIAKKAADLAAEADRMNKFSAAFGPLYASFSDDQKEVIGPVIRDLRVMGGRHGERGWRRHGHWRGQRGHMMHDGADKRGEQ